MFIPFGEIPADSGGFPIAVLKSIPYH